jgi:hypothetical protein
MSGSWNNIIRRQPNITRMLDNTENMAVKLVADRDRYKSERDRYKSERDRYKSERDKCVLSKPIPVTGLGTKSSLRSPTQTTAATKNIIYGAPEQYKYNKNKRAFSAWETPSVVQDPSANRSGWHNITNVQEPNTPPPRGGRMSRKNRKNRNRKNKSRRR